MYNGDKTEFGTSEIIRNKMTSVSSRSAVNRACCHSMFNIMHTEGMILLSDLRI